MDGNLVKRFRFISPESQLGIFKVIWISLLIQNYNVACQTQSSSKWSCQLINCTYARHRHTVDVSDAIRDVLWIVVSAIAVF